MARRQVLVQLTDDLLEALDREASRTGESRSAVLREAATQYLAETEEARISRLIIEGYTRMPQTDDETDEWGPLSAMQDFHLAENLRDLDREEREAGFDPW